MATARCTKCGSENPKEALFCTACGQALHHAQNDPLVGQTIGGRYHLVERIGQGAAGTIYRAEHTTLRRRMAVKLLHQQLAQNEDAVERFRREAITVCEIDNDHIPQVFDFGRAEDGRLFFAMEFLDGVPLSVALERESRLTPERTADILAQIGDGLMEAHTLGYIHRDLRPRSIFLTRRRGRADFVKILDFGLAKLVQPELTDAQRTAMGMTYGDPRYMAPEQARGEVVDRRADIYSLGVLGYEMVCGEPPFKGNGTFDVLSKLLEAPVPRLRDKRPDCPPWLESVIRTALAKKPAERFQTVAQFLDAMERKNVLANQPPLPMQVAPGAKADAMKKLTPMSAPPDTAPKGQEVRAFVSYPVMKAINVPVEDPPRPVAQSTQAMPTVAPGTQAAALAAAVATIEPQQHQQPQSIKKTLAYPTIKVGQRSEPVGSPPAVSTPAEPVRPPLAAKPATETTSGKPSSGKPSADSSAVKPATAKLAGGQNLKSGFVNIVATAIERGDPTPRTARAMLEQESLAWEEAALPALVTNEVDLTSDATTPDLRRLPPSADTPVEEMSFDAAPAPAKRVPAAVTRPEPAKSQAPAARPEPVKSPAAAPREQLAKEPSVPTGQRDSSRIAAMATPAPTAGREPSGPATKHGEPPRPSLPLVTAATTTDVARATSGTSSLEVRPLSAPMIGRQTQPGMGPLAPDVPLTTSPVLEPAPASTFGAADDEPDEDATVPNLKHAETHKVEKVAAADLTETVKHSKLSPAAAAHLETAKVVKVDAAAAQPAAESERTPETPPPEMGNEGSEGDAGWFAQSAPAALADDEDALTIKKKTPKWVAPAVLSAAAVVGLLLWAQSGTKTESAGSGPASTLQQPTRVPPSAVIPSPSVTAPSAASPESTAGPKVEAAAMPSTAPVPTESKPATAEPSPAPPAAKPEPVAAAKTDEPVKPVVEALPIKAAPEPVAKPEPKPEPKPVAKVEPKPEPRPVAKPEPKPEPKPVAKVEPKPEPKPVAKVEPKPAAAEAKASEPAAAKPTAEIASLVSMGKQKLDDGEVDAAVASFKRAVQLDGKNAEAVAGLGEASFEQGNFDGAVKYLGQAARLSPRKSAYQELLAQAQFKLGRYKEAAETCRKILKDNPGSSRAKQTLEQAEKKLDDM
ncbi:MAG: protein kinase [Myxococcales bacterium]|nr:protein kinase [Myxococcales bacterium]